MAKNKKSSISIKDILKGKFLVEEGSFKNWRFVVYLAALAFISIASSHWADKKVIKIRNLQKDVSELKSEFADLHKDVMQGQMESMIGVKVMNDSLKKSIVPPFKLIKITHD